jgi:type II secretory pathway pseudopilin PulG
MLSDRVRRSAGSEAGVTLVELLVVLLLLGIIGGVVASAITTALRSATATQARIDALQELEVALQRMTRDFRTASELQLAPLADATATFDDYLGADILRDGTLEQVRYRLVDPGGGQPQELVRVDTGQTLVTLVDNGGEPVFRYLRFDGSEVDCDGLTESACGDEILEGVTTIGIRLVRDIEGRAPVRAETRVAVRSIRYGR